MTTKCPHCGQEYDVGAEYVGQKADCESCNKSFLITDANKHRKVVYTPNPPASNKSKAAVQPQRQFSQKTNKETAPKRGSFKLVLICVFAAAVYAVVAFVISSMSLSAESLYQKGMKYHEKAAAIRPDFKEDIERAENLRKKAVKFYRKAADKGHAEARYELALCYSTGIGVIKNRGQAASLYRLAAEQGHTEAQNSLAHHYEFYLKNYVEAVNWYRKAAEQGHTDSCMRLGYLYSVGTDDAVDRNNISKNRAESAKWYRKVLEICDENDLSARQARRMLELLR